MLKSPLYTLISQAHFTFIALHDLRLDEDIVVFHKWCKQIKSAIYKSQNSFSREHLVGVSLFLSRKGFSQGGTKMGENKRGRDEIISLWPRLNSLLFSTINTFSLPYPWKAIHQTLYPSKIWKYLGDPFCVPIHIFSSYLFIR